MQPQFDLRDPQFEARLFGVRTIVAIGLVVVLLGVVLMRYYALQITEHEIYRTQSERNRVQLQPLPPRRGLIYDRNGVVAILRQRRLLQNPHHDLFQRHIYDARQSFQFVRIDGAEFLGIHAQPNHRVCARQQIPPSIDEVPPACMTNLELLPVVLHDFPEAVALPYVQKEQSAQDDAEG